MRDWGEKRSLQSSDGVAGAKSIVSAADVEGGALEVGLGVESGLVHCWLRLSVHLVLFLKLVSTGDRTYHVLSGGDAGEDERENGELHVCGWLEKKNWIVWMKS